MNKNIKLKNQDNVNIIYHGKDFDGIGSAAVIVDQLKEQGFKGKFNLFPMEHHDELKYKPQKNDNVFVVDFALDMDTMLDIADKGDLYWIDHHKTAKDTYEKYDKKAEFDKKAKYISIDNSMAACKQTWNFFTGNEKSRLIDNLNDFDIFDQSNKDAFFLDYALTAMSKYTDPEYKGWHMLIDCARKEKTAKNKPQANMIDSFIEKGKLIKSYMHTQNAKRCARDAFEVKIGDLTGIALSVREQGSQVFDPIKQQKEHDFYLTYKVGYDDDGKQVYDFGMYKDNAINDLHCGKFAKENFGGGGHAGAAGFRNHEFPVDLIKPVIKDKNKEKGKASQKKSTSKDKNNNVHIIYHGGDFDGIGSAAILVDKLKKDGYEGEFGLHPIDRGQELDYQASKGDKIYVVDYSLDMKLMHAFGIKGIYIGLIIINQHLMSLMIMRKKMNS